jgi:Fuc2NAc and GlcNAc transferase
LMTRCGGRLPGICWKGACVAIEITLTCVLVLASAAVLTAYVRRFALSRGLLDVPNARSSHSAVTPRGGGLSMVMATSVAWIALTAIRMIPPNLMFALAGGLVVAAVGFMDDRSMVSPAVRLVVHLGAALWAVIWLGGLPPIRIAGEILQLGWAGSVLAVLGIAWTLNLFNFMDGIDGIAASEAVFIGFGAALLTLLDGNSLQVASVGLVFGAASAGFLLWNWPPAKIFMGDVGSGYLGYVIGVLALVAGRENSSALWVWLILGGVFFVDATVTLLRRTLRGDRVYEAHRSHAYQWLARRWRSHRPVTIAVTAVNLFWLLPCAWFATRYPALGVWITLLALIPLAAVAIVAGAGRRENE